ncbi:MAG: kynureninase [Marivibrio sp.]|uniref:kynureninase n=1 Tax=Marivibrio sp. TaxID=2039719 RepID=UPI0032EAAE6B
MRDLEAVRALDAADPLAGFRDRFILPAGEIYLDGNSLGPAPKAALDALRTAAEAEWAQGLIRSWNEADWFTLTDRLGARIGRLIGAAEGETVVCDSTSINIFKAVQAALALNPDRPVIVAEGDGFPTDLYILEGIRSLRPDLEIRRAEAGGPTLEYLLDDRVAVLLVNQVDYRSGARRDVAAVTAAAHAVGALVVWDLCHSAGVMPVDFAGSGADFAVGCSYKYLNGGPGAPAFVAAATKHHGRMRQPLSGWWGHAAPFAFAPDYDGDPGIRRMLCGTQPILSLRAMEAGLEIAEEADLAAVRAKSEALTDLFVEAAETLCAGHGLTLASPRVAAERGSQVAFRHADGYPIMQALIAAGVIGDFRSPDILRFGFAPLYLGYADVVEAVDRLADILETGRWKEPRFQKRAAVT